MSARVVGKKAAFRDFALEEGRFPRGTSDMAPAIARIVREG
jgi:hypothetical protein